MGSLRQPGGCMHVSNPGAPAMFRPAWTLHQLSGSPAWPAIEQQQFRHVHACSMCARSERTQRSWTHGDRMYLVASFSIDSELDVSSRRDVWGSMARGAAAGMTPAVVGRTPECGGPSILRNNPPKRSCATVTRSTSRASTSRRRLSACGSCSGITASYGDCAGRSLASRASP